MYHRHLWVSQESLYCERTNQHQLFDRVSVGVGTLPEGGNLLCVLEAAAGEMGWNGNYEARSWVCVCGEVNTARPGVTRRFPDSPSCGFS